MSEHFISYTYIPTYIECYLTLPTPAVSYTVVRFLGKKVPPHARAREAAGLRVLVLLFLDFSFLYFIIGRLGPLERILTYIHTSIHARTVSILRVVIIIIIIIFLCPRTRGSEGQSLWVVTRLEFGSIEKSRLSRYSRPRLEKRAWGEESYYLTVR